MSDPELDAFVRRLNNRCGTPGKPKASWLSEANAKLTACNVVLNVQRVTSQLTGQVHWILINRRKDHVVHSFGISWSQGEREYMDRITCGIVESRKGSLNKKDVESLRKNIARDAADRFIHQLIQDRWLEAVGDQHVTLGVRAIAELSPYVKELYHVEDCKACGQMCVFKRQCQSNQCKVTMHPHCADQWFANREPKCPDCLSPFGGNDE